MTTPKTAVPRVAAPGVPSQKQTLHVWLKENETTSDGQVFEAEAQDLEDLMNLFGKYAHVDGQKPLQGIFKWDPYTKAQPKVTQDPFDQGELYFALGDLAHTMNDLGFEFEKIIGNRHKKIPHPMVAHANKVEDLNAWYSPQDDDLTFGTSNGTWDLASDADVTVHEAGHLILDHFHPNLGGSFGGNEGGAIHEGFGDAVASLRHDNPVMSEDFVKALGRTPSKNDGLRRVDNELTLDQVGGEVHDRGQVYAGFFWSLRNALGTDLTFELLMNHAANYRTSLPKPSDFVDAVLKGAEALSQAGKLGDVPLEKIQMLVMAEAKKRHLIGVPVPPKKAPPYLSFEHAVSQAVSEFGGATGADATSVVSFRKVSEVPYLGGVQTKYQQYYSSKYFGELPVLERGILLNSDPNRKNVEASFQDGLQMQAGTVDETLKISLPQALRKVDAFLKNETVHWVQEQQSLKKEALAMSQQKISPASYVQHKQSVDATERVLKKSREVFQAGRPTTRLVVSPDGKSLMYEFKLGYARCYVDAVNDSIAFHPDFFY